MLEEKVTNIVFSKYFNKEFEVQTFASADNPDVQVISHDSLERIIFDEIPLLFPDQGLNYDVCVDYPKIGNPSPDPNHFVYRCTMWDKSNRKVMKVGETKTETLDTEIARNHPALIAQQRAFDRAAIAYLQLPGKTFSTIEGVPYCGTDVQCLDEPVVVVKPPEVSNPIPATNAVPETPATQEDITVGCENVLINIGVYKKTPKTVKELYKENPGYVKWIANTYDIDNDMKKACIEYLKHIEEEIAYGTEMAKR